MYSLELDITYDGSRLDRPDQEGDPEIHVWTSVNDAQSIRRVEWADSERLVSKKMTVTVDMENQYDGEDTPFRHDAAIWFGALAQSPNAQKVAVRQRVGAGQVYLHFLADSDDEIDVPLQLFNHTDRQGVRYTKGMVTIHAVRLADGFVPEFAETAGPFEYIPQNAALLHSSVRSFVQRAIYPFTEEAEGAGLAIKPAVKFVKRVHAPFFNTTAGMLPGPLYWVFARQYQHTAPSEAWAEKLVDLALRRANRSRAWMQGAIEDQFDDADAKWVSDEFVEAVEIVGTALCIVSTSLPYTGDRVDLNRRDTAFVSSTNVHPAESFDEALLRQGGDCEDLGHAEYEVMDVLLKGVPSLARGDTWARRGSFHSPLLQNIQRVLHLYVGLGSLGSVMSAALGNSNGTKTKKAQFIIDSRADANVEVGAHMWTELVPQRKFVALVRRTAPDLDEAQLLDPAMVDAPWTYTLPHLVLEGTGRLKPLQLPRVAYCSPYDTIERRKAVVARDDMWHATLAALMGSAKIFKVFQVERRQANTTRVPNARVNTFYRRATYAYTPYLLERGLGIPYLTWVNRGDRVTEPGNPLYTEAASAIASTKLREQAIEYEAAHTEELHEVAAIGAKEDSPGHTPAMLLARRLATGSFDRPNRADDEITYGVNMADRLRQEPAWPEHVALLPGHALDEVEAASIASFMRQLKPNIVPDLVLETSPSADDWRMVRSTQTKRADWRPEAEAHAHEEVFDDVKQRVRALFAGWHEDDVDTDDRVLLTLFFKPYDLVSDDLADAIEAAVRAQRDAGLVLNARVYLEAPIEQIENGVLQLQCRAQKSQQ